AMRRHVFVAGLYAAARARLVGHGLPSGLRLPTKMTSSRPVHAPSGPWLPASGDGASLRHVFVAGVNAAPALKASPQQPPPQPTNSFPVQTASRPAFVGGRGNMRQLFVAGSYDSASNGPQTSICRPVHAAS